MNQMPPNDMPPAPPMPMDGGDAPEGDMPEPPMEGEAPDGMTESKKGLNDLVNEIVNNILSDMETSDDEDRRDNKIRNRKISTDNPYVSKR